MERYPGLDWVVAGGVAANKVLRSTLTRLAQRQDCALYYPSLHYCTDNAAMIALAGLERYNKKKFNKCNFEVRPRWALDVKAEFLKGSGVKL